MYLRLHNRKTESENVESTVSETWWILKYLSLTNIGEVKQRV